MSTVEGVTTQGTFHGIPLTDEVVEQIADSTLAELDDLRDAWAKGDHGYTAARLLWEKGVKRAYDRAEAVKALRSPDPITASEQEVHLHVIIPVCCKPDQMEQVARDVARALHYSVGGGVQVVYGGVRQMFDGVEVTFDPLARRGKAVSP